MSSLIALLFGLLCTICSIVILVDAFKRSVLKGLICVCCWFYFFWYAFFEFKHDNKFLIVVGSILGGGVWGAIHFLKI